MHLLLKCTQLFSLLVLCCALSIAATLNRTDTVSAEDNNHYYDSQFEPEQTDVSDLLVCPLWTLPTPNGTCTCGNRVNGLVNCQSDSEDTISIQLPYCYCMTYNEELKTPVTGHCMYTCQVSKTVPGHAMSCLYHYHVVVTTNDTSEINENVCGNLHMHRTGQLCGKCKKGYGLPVYSYTMACVECTDYKYNWLKYIAVAFLPLTLFYFVIILFRISATSGTLNAYIILCQFLTSKTALLYFSSYHSEHLYFKILTTMHSVWNLDFFRSVYPPFCLHPKMTSLQVLALEYTIAVYPLLLIVITYIFASLHYRYPLVVKLWRPFYRCFAHIRKEWEIKSSLISAFATFLLLSFVKILNVSFDILTPTVLYDVNGTRLSTQYVYSDASIEYFGKEHLPYAVLALIMLVVFNFLPAFLLLLYPCRCFHRFLNLLKFRGDILYTFMDTFQGLYKLKPRDGRYFSALYLFIRILNLALLCLTNGALYFPLLGFVLMLMTVAMAIARPYKKSIYNSIEIVFFALLTLTSVAYPIHVYSRLLSTGTNTYHLASFLGILVLLLPVIIYGGGLLLYRFLPRRWLKAAWTKCKSVKDRYFPSTEERLPYRLEHMDEYTPIKDTVTPYSYS